MVWEGGRLAAVSVGVCRNCVRYCFGGLVGGIWQELLLYGAIVQHRAVLLGVVYFDCVLMSHGECLCLVYACRSTCCGESAVHQGAVCLHDGHSFVEGIGGV